MHVEEDIANRNRTIEDMRGQIAKLNMDVDNQRTNVNTIERSKNDLLQKFEDLKFDIGCKAD